MRTVACLLAALALVGGACSSDDDDASPSSTTTTTSSTSVPEEDDENDENDEDAAGDDAVAEEIVDSLVAQGLSEELARCAIDFVVAEGVSMDELEAGMTMPSQELADVLGRAGAACAASGEMGELPPGAVDLSNPVVRDQFVKNFAASSGLSIEVSECVADSLLVSGLDLSRLAQPDDPQVQEYVNAAVEGCGGTPG